MIDVGQGLRRCVRSVRVAAKVSNALSHRLSIPCPLEAFCALRRNRPCAAR